MKDKFKFMGGNEFEGPPIKSGWGIQGNNWSNSLIWEGNGYLTVTGELKQFEDHEFKLSGITADCLIALAKKTYLILVIGKIIALVDRQKIVEGNCLKELERTIELGGDVKLKNISLTSFNKLEKETDKQFYLRIAKEMGWIDE